MATENDFNSHLTSLIRRMGTSYKCLKVADKVKSGISDFLIFHAGRAIAIECKHIAELPAGNGRALKHAVSGPQQTFLKSMALAGIPGYIVIACAKDRSMTVCPIEDVPPAGNWNTPEILEMRRRNGVYFYKDADRMVRDFFEGGPALGMVG